MNALTIPNGTSTLTVSSPLSSEQLVLACGCFDLLHVGHLRLLAAARKLGTRLVVGLNSDESVRQLKGERRPIQPQRERREMLLALRAVEEVVIFDELTPERLIRERRPAFYVKGAEYGLEVGQIPEARAVEAVGGQLVFMAMTPGRSTTATLDRIQARADGHP